MVRDINYSVGKFSRGFNSPLTKAEIKHTINNSESRNTFTKYASQCAAKKHCQKAPGNWGFNVTSKYSTLELGEYNEQR